MSSPTLTAARPLLTPLPLPSLPLSSLRPHRTALSCATEDQRPLLSLPPAEQERSAEREHLPSLQGLSAMSSPTLTAARPLLTLLPLPSLLLSSLRPHRTALSCATEDRKTVV